MLKTDNEHIEELKKEMRKKDLSELLMEMEELTCTPGYDCELLCAYLDVMEELDPILPPDYDPAADFEKFQAKYVDLFKKMMQ